MVLAAVTATPDEVAAARPGDDIVAAANVVMDRGFTLSAPPAAIWPWLVQLGKGRAGWYLPRSVERAIPPGRRGARTIDPRWQDLQLGDVVPDYGGRDATFTVAAIRPPGALVYSSWRGHLQLSWALTVTALPATGTTTSSRVHLRLRLGPVRHPWLAGSAGDLFDALSIAGMAAGLRERLGEAGHDRAPS